MLEYECGNLSSMLLTGAEETTQESDPNRQIFHNHNHHHHQQQEPFNESTLFSQQNHFHNNPNQAQAQNQANFHSLYDPHSYCGASAYSTTHASFLSLDHTFSGAGGTGGGGYFLVPKSEEVSRPVDFTARIGLNLGGRTYFSSAEDDFVNRLYRRSRPGDIGSVNSPRCQAEGCNADLTHAKHYHRRHKVCEFHSKASTVIAAGLTKRFCQQCSRFHLLSEFDNGKRSCRKRLADHNRRRRKSQQQPNCTQENQKQLVLPVENPPKSSPESGIMVTVSPPRMSLDCFKQIPYNGTVSSTPSGTLFFSSG